MWLDSWAFATSPAPYGLGMSTQESWALTPREFQAREKVHEAYMWRWAKQLAVIANAPHFHKKDNKAYESDDFFSTPEAIARRNVRLKQEQKDALDLMWMRQRMNRKIKEEDLPDVFRGPYKGSAPMIGSGVMRG